MLKINQTIETTNGFTVPTGSIVKFGTIFPHSGYEIRYDMEFYKDQEAIDNGSANYYPKDMPNMDYKKTLTFDEYTGLTPTVVHQELKNYLSTVFTGGTIDIII